MGDRAGIIIGIGLFVAVLIDNIVLDTLVLTFLGKELIKLLEFIAFWR